MSRLLTRFRNSTAQLRFIDMAIALVWLVNGLFCKVLGFAPRHQLIVGRILGHANEALLARSIGVLEVLMAAWILGRYRSRMCACTQAVVIAAMNILECIYAPDLLLFGYANALVAAFFIILILVSEFRSGLPGLAKQ